MGHMSRVLCALVSTTISIEPLEKSAFQDSIGGWLQINENVSLNTREYFHFVYIILAGYCQLNQKADQKVLAYKKKGNMRKKNLFRK
jgi:hypothetical protein